MTVSTELSKRIVTAVLGVTALVWLIVYGGWPGAMLLSTVLSLGMVWECASITLSLPDKVEKRYVLLCITWFVALANFLAPKSEFELAMEIGRAHV